MSATQEVLRKLDRCNREAFNCLANLEAFGKLDPGILLGLKDWLQETRLLVERGLQLEEGRLRNIAPALDSRAARTDLTNRECSKLLGGIIGVLCQMASTAIVREAVCYWANTDDLWEILAMNPFTADKERDRQQ